MNTTNNPIHATDTFTSADAGNQIAVDAFMAIGSGNTLANIARNSANALIADSTDEGSVFSEELTAFIQQLMEMLLPETISKMLELADRIERNENVTMDEIGEAFEGADQATIDAIEVLLADAGNPPLPPHINPGSPEFQAAAETIHELFDAGADHDNTEYQNAFHNFHKLAPPWLKKALREKADELGLMPKPDFVTETGEPAFSTECIAKHFGKTEEEIIAGIQQLEAGDIVTGTVFRIQ